MQEYEAAIVNWQGIRLLLPVVIFRYPIRTITNTVWYFT
jgi:hypothetical protein